MRRRDIFTALGGATLWPLTARAQQAGRIPLVGVLWHGSAEKEWSNPFYHYVHDNFTAHGYVSGKTIRYEERYANENQETYERLANELVAFDPDLLLALNQPAAVVLKAVTSRIPIVFIGVSDPVGQGLVESIARPGGNATGMANVPPETYKKRVQILAQLVPGVSRLALVADLGVPPQVAFEREQYAAAAASNGVELVDVFHAQDKVTIEAAFSRIVEANCQAAVISQQGLFYLFRDELAAAALANHLPTMGPSEAFVPNGTLVAYSAVTKDRFVDLIDYAARVLRGEKPADLPVQYPTRLQLVINLKTASALGIRVPEDLLASASRLIE